MKKILKLTILFAILTSMFLSLTFVATAVDDVLYISDMTWDSSACHSWVGGVPLRDKDCNSPSKLVMEGITFNKSIVMPPSDDLTDAYVEVTVPEGYYFFETVVGKDSKDGYVGFYEAKVLVNGIEVASTGVTNKWGLRPLFTAVSPGDVLRLVTTTGGDGATSDTIGWGDTRLTKTIPSMLYVSDMSWTEATIHPFCISVKRDANGYDPSNAPGYSGPLKVGGEIIQKGIGTAAWDSYESHATVSFIVPGGYYYFEAQAALDDIAGTDTDGVEFRLLVNGVLADEVFMDNSTRGIMHTLHTSVLPGDTVSLVTTNGGPGKTASSDMADWCNAALYSKKTVDFDTFDKTSWGNGDTAGNKATLNFVTTKKYNLTLSVKVDKNLGRSTIAIKDKDQNIIASKKIDCFFVTSTWVNVAFTVNSGGNYTLEITADGKNYTEISNVNFNEALGTATAGNAVVIDGVVISEEEL